MDICPQRVSVWRLWHWFCLPAKDPLTFTHLLARIYNHDNQQSGAPYMSELVMLREPVVWDYLD